MKKKGKIIGLIFSLTLIISNKNVVAQQNYLDINPGINYGVRFWGGNDAYSIKMGHGSQYTYGPVASNFYSIKSSMPNGWGGWTWGVNGLQPKAALSSAGTMQLAKDLYVMENVGIGTTAPSYKLHINNGSSGTALRADAINGHIRLFETDGAGPTTNFTQIERNGDAFHIYQNDGSSYQQVLTAKMDGKVGLGTTSPDAGFHVADDGTTALDAHLQGFTLIDGSEASLLLGRQTGAVHGEWGIEYNNWVGGLNFWKPGGATTGSGNYFLFIADDGDVSIGTEDSKGYKLAVKGNVIAESVTVKLCANWPDYVFTKEYGLMDLNDVESFIDEISVYEG